MCVTLERFSHSCWRGMSCTQPREGEGSHSGNHSAPYLDRLGARDDDRGFVEDVDPHDGSILLGPRKQSDAKEAVDYQGGEYPQLSPGPEGETQQPILGGGGDGGGGSAQPEAKALPGCRPIAESHPPLASVSTSMK